MTVNFNLDDLSFDKYELLPAIIQDYDNGQVLMLAYMNRESLRRTLETGLTCFWSRSRQEYWQKGETSGNIQIVQEIYYDCDADTLLVKVKQIGPACHTGERSCFYRTIPLPQGNKKIIFSGRSGMILEEWKQHIIEVIPGFVIITFNEKGIFQLSLGGKAAFRNPARFWKKCFPGPLFMMSFRDTLGGKLRATIRLFGMVILTGL